MPSPPADPAPQRGLIGPSLMAAVMVAMLLGLGVWQLHRLAWKRGILAAIDHAEASPPIPLPAHPSQFQKVGVTGVLEPGHLIYGADVRDTPQGPMLGGQLIQPLRRQGAPPVLIDRGWVPDRTAAAIATPDSPVQVAGYVRLPDRPGRFTPHDDPATNRVYTLDPATMGAALGLKLVAPFTLVALGTAADTTPPIPATALPRPPNDHLQYALTWFGLAASLVGVYASWLRGAVRRSA